jgi:unsaturated rhamnogalacturonyl hydrolase
MNKYLIGLLSLFLATTVDAQKLPSSKKILKTATLANKYFMDKWPDPFKPIFVPSRNRTWPSNIWTKAVYYEGLMALYSVDKKKAYYDYAVDWANKNP